MIKSADSLHSFQRSRKCLQNKLNRNLKIKHAHNRRSTLRLKPISLHRTQIKTVTTAEKNPTVTADAAAAWKRPQVHRSLAIYIKTTLHLVSSYAMSILLRNSLSLVRGRLFTLASTSFYCTSLEPTRANSPSLSFKVYFVIV